jgi:hypothetical protein
MTTYVDILVENVEILLREPAINENGFVARAIAGETLRHALQASEQRSEAGFTTLARYDAWLSSYHGPVPEGLEGDIKEVLDELDEYTLAPGKGRDPNAGESVLDDLEEVLLVAVAEWRSKRLNESVLNGLALRVRDELGRKRGLLAGLWDAVLDRRGKFGAPADVAHVFAWWDDLADLSQTSLELPEALRMWPTARREDVIQQAVARLAQSAAERNPLEMAESVLRWTGRWLQGCVLQGKMPPWSEAMPEIERIFDARVCAVPQSAGSDDSPVGFFLTHRYFTLSVERRRSGEFLFRVAAVRGQDEVAVNALGVGRTTSQSASAVLELTAEELANAKPSDWLVVNRGAK